MFCGFKNIEWWWEKYISHLSVTYHIAGFSLSRAHGKLLCSINLSPPSCLLHMSINTHLKMVNKFILKWIRWIEINWECHLAFKGVTVQMLLHSSRSTISSTDVKALPLNRGYISITLQNQTIDSAPYNRLVNHEKARSPAMQIYP